MSFGWAKAKLISASIALALLHFAVFTVSYVQSAVVPSSAQHTALRAVVAVLAFPLVHVTNLLSPIDLFPIAVVANSLLWGAVFILGVRAAAARRRKGDADAGSPRGD